MRALGIEVRRDARKYTSLGHLNRFVDAVRPEAKRFATWSGPICATFRAWIDNDRRVERLGIGELSSLSKNLSALGVIGLQALDNLESGRPAPEKWIAEKKQLLDKMEKPNAEVRLAAVRTVRLLLGSL
jgi:hypothetical protein